MGDAFKPHALVDRLTHFRRVQHDAMFCVWERFQRTLNGGTQSDFSVTVLYQDEQETNLQMQRTDEDGIKHTLRCCAEVATNATYRHSSSNRVVAVETGLPSIDTIQHS